MWLRQAQPPSGRTLSLPKGPRVWLRQAQPPPPSLPELLPKRTLSLSKGAPVGYGFDRLSHRLTGP